jgi:hypothetical protein
MAAPVPSSVPDTATSAALAEQYLQQYHQYVAEQPPSTSAGIPSNPMAYSGVGTAEGPEGEPLAPEDAQLGLEQQQQQQPGGEG